VLIEKTESRENPIYCAMLIAKYHRAGGAIKEVSKFEVDALGVITISRGCFERCGSNKKTPP